MTKKHVLISGQVSEGKTTSFAEIRLRASRFKPSNIAVYDLAECEFINAIKSNSNTHIILRDG